MKKSINKAKISVIIPVYNSLKTNNAGISCCGFYRFYPKTNKAVFSCMKKNFIAFDDISNISNVFKKTYKEDE